MSRLNVDQIYTRTGTGTPALREMPAFSVYLSASQSVTSGEATKVALDTVVFDTNSWFDTTNYRYVPQIAGYYKFDGLVKIAGISQTIQVAYIHKNGEQYSHGNLLRLSTSLAVHCVVSNIIYLNGSTDYVELFGAVTASSPNFQYTAPTNTSFLTGFLVRPD